MKKLYFTSLLAMMVAPAVAAPTHTSSTFPSNGIMEEDYTYQNQATVTNLKVSSGTATTTANYDNCPSGYPNSDEGTTSTDQCYTACTVSDFPANSHIASVTGKNYQGSGVTDTCAIASCDTGYHLNPGNPDLMTLIGESQEVSAVGFVGQNEGMYGITQNGEFVVDFGNKGKIRGFARCSTQSGTNNWDGNATTMSTLPDSTGQYCWCKLDGYAPNGQAMQSFSVPWVFVIEGSGDCVDQCTNICIDSVAESGNYRFELFNVVAAAGAPSCEANTIQITWADASAEDIAANDAGSVTYGGDIRTPKKAVHKPGKIFTGWIFNAQ